MDHFMDEYFSVDKFKKAYARRVEHIGDRSFWPQVSIAREVGAPLSKRPVGRQRKNRIKGCLEGGSSKKPSANEKEKEKKLIREKFKCPNCNELGHRKNSPKCPLNGTKKRKRKPRKNTTKQWFPKEYDAEDVDASSPPPPSPTTEFAAEDAAASSPPPTPPTTEIVSASSPPPAPPTTEGDAASSPPRQQKRAVCKLTLKKKVAV